MDSYSTMWGCGKQFTGNEGTSLPDLITAVFDW